MRYFNEKVGEQVIISSPSLDMEKKNERGDYLINFAVRTFSKLLTYRKVNREDGHVEAQTTKHIMKLVLKNTSSSKALVCLIMSTLAVITGW